jgi:hypothetical protein
MLRTRIEPKALCSQPLELECDERAVHLWPVMNIVQTVSEMVKLADFETVQCSSCMCNAHCVVTDLCSSPALVGPITARSEHWLKGADLVSVGACSKRTQRRKMKTSLLITMMVVLFNIVGRRTVHPCIWFCICNEYWCTYSDALPICHFFSVVVFCLRQFVCLGSCTGALESGCGG